MKRAALISVYDKSGLLEFAGELNRRGYILLGTQGSKSYLEGKDIPVHSIEEYTGQKEILGGRVKTLHPKIHAGLLARRDSAEDMAQLTEAGIYPIDFAVINLYPFVQNVRSEAAKDPKKMIELIDVGGPTMVRAAAKNFLSVVPLIDPNDYGKIIEYLARGEDIPVEERRALAVKVFASTAAYDLEISRYFSGVTFDGGEGKVLDESYPLINGVILERKQNLRYGENPHQKGALYVPFGRAVNEKCPWTQRGGKELSYNNLLDTSATLSLIRALPKGRAAAVIIKHLNPCGIALDTSTLSALKKAKLCDPRSHFGGIIGLNQEVSKEVAEEIREDFAEIVLAPSFTDGALEVLKQSKNLRVLTVDLDYSEATEFRSVEGGVLFQSADALISPVKEAKVVSNRAPTDSEISDLELAWIACAHVKSNAIVIAKNGMLVGVGGGQMSRIDAAEVALLKANVHGHDLTGAVAASDAFFPFPDTIEALAQKGIKAVIAPSGAKRDGESIETANRAGVSLLFTGDRHFRH